jgi:Sec-independent protein secretion pathway component TatC
MAGPVGLGGSDYVQPKRLKQSWRFLLLCAAIIGAIVYLLFFR